MSHEATFIKHAVQSLRHVLKGCGYDYKGESLTVIEIRAARLKKTLTDEERLLEFEREITMLKDRILNTQLKVKQLALQIDKIKKNKDKEERILELRRQIATFCCREDYAFDAPTVAPLIYDVNYKIVRVLSTMKNSLEKLTAWINTSSGIYCLTGELFMFRNVSGEWHIETKLESPPALQNVSIFGYKLFNEREQCIQYNVYPTFKRFVPGDILSISRTIAHS